MEYIENVIKGLNADGYKTEIPNEHAESFDFFATKQGIQFKVKIYHTESDGEELTEAETDKLIKLMQPASHYCLITNGVLTKAAKRKLQAEGLIIMDASVYRPWNKK